MSSLEGEASSVLGHRLDSVEVVGEKTRPSLNQCNYNYTVEFFQPQSVKELLTVHVHFLSNRYPLSCCNASNLPTVGHSHQHHLQKP